MPWAGSLGCLPCGARSPLRRGEIPWSLLVPALGFPSDYQFRYLYRAARSPMEEQSRLQQEWDRSLVSRPLSRLVLQPLLLPPPPQQQQTTVHSHDDDCMGAFAFRACQR